jgi:AcrR family transcriptional regulator
MKPVSEAALDAFIRLIAEKGFADVALRDVAEAAGLGLAELYRVYSDKVALVAAFLAKIDAEVLAGTPSRSDPEETARDRLFDAMMRRYDALRPYREALGAIRRAGASPIDGRHAGGRLGSERRPGWCAAAKWAAGDSLCRVARLRQGRDHRSVQDHGGLGQPPENGGAVGSTL